MTKKGEIVLKRISIALLVLMAILLTGCLGSPKLEVGEVEWQYPSNFSSTGYLHGVVKNVGSGDARYVEVGVLLYQNGVVVASGWTNLTHVAANSSRAFKVIVFDFPVGPFKYEIYTSLSPGGVPK